jgi:hypothetical protein
MRVTVDGAYGTPEVIENSPSLKAVLVLDNGDIAEVQIAQRGDSLVVLAAGAVDYQAPNPKHEIAFMVVEPTAKVPA